MTDQPLWQPSKDRIENSNIYSFMQKANEKSEKTINDYKSLWHWSVTNIEDFWNMVWDECNLIGDKGQIILKDGDDMMKSEFFPDSKVNYAENCLRRRDNHPAMIFRDETGTERTVTFNELYNQVSSFRQYLIKLGIKKGDRIAGYMPNMPETIITMLAATSIGAIWSSASPDFGAQGVLDRFGQIEPEILITVNGYYYNGKEIDILPKIKEIQPQLKSLKKTIIIEFTEQDYDISNFKNTETYNDIITKFEPTEIKFERFEFNHPLYIMFSSGTTGIPKCIIHGHGGTLIQHLKEFALQCDTNKDDVVFYFTTCGWMMWNWLVSGLTREATLLLYDGSPFYPNGEVLWDFTSKHKCKLFGTAAKYIDAIKKADISPKEKYDLSSIKTLCSTGSPLVHESFDYIYKEIKSDLLVSSISGGTDIISSFFMASPISPIYHGEIQCAGLGMAMAVYDANGKPIESGAGSGEMVCVAPFPSMPVSFWNDNNNDRYKSAYFNEFNNIWCHGDWIERTRNSGYIIHGRSDATLNPGGVRIGTAEIYRQVEQVPQVLESIAVGQDWDGDTRIILFVKLKENTELNDALIKEIKTKVRSGASPRHVPAKIIQIADIPRTKSNKIVEIAVRHIIHNRPVKNIEALANPEALELYKNIKEIKEA